MKFALLALLLAGCTNQCYPEADYWNWTSYTTVITHDTPGGIHLDDPQHQLDPARVDRAVKNVVACLAQFKVQPMSTAELNAAECYGRPTLEIRACLVVKVPDWHPSCRDPKEEVFLCDVPNASCTEKGLTPTVECPCSCRAMIQDNTTLLTTPNMRLFPAYLTTLLTGCNRPWNNRIASCSSPDLAGE